MHLLCDQAEGAGNVQPGEGKLHGDLANVYKCLKGGCRQDGALCPVAGPEAVGMN